MQLFQSVFNSSGTRFHLLSETANMALKVSEDKNSVQYPVETYNKMFTLIEWELKVPLTSIITVILFYSATYLFRILKK